MFPKVSPYVITKLIGSGTFSSVYEGYHSLLEFPVAIKVISKDSFDYNHFLLETNFVRQLSHPLIAEFYESFELEGNYIIIMELIKGGSLLTKINELGKMSESMAKNYFMQTVCVIDYLHNEMSITHRDLKADNIMIDQNDEIKIIDFGLSHVLTSTNMPNLMTQCGTPGYAAPEMIIGQPYNKSADIWSLGITLYAMVVGELPFVGNEKEIFDMIVYDEPEYPRYLSKPIVDLLKKMLNKSPTARIDISKIKEMEWFPKDEYKVFMKRIDSQRTENFIDESILKEMQEMGLNAELCRQNLADKDATALSSIYKQLKNKQRANNIHPSNTKSLRSSLRLETEHPEPKPDMQPSKQRSFNPILQRKPRPIASRQ